MGPVDGSSFMQDGNWKVGNAVVTVKEMTEAKALLSNISVQKAKLTALLRVLELSKDKSVYIWTDLEFDYRVFHDHGDNCRQRGLTTSQGSSVKRGSTAYKLSIRLKQWQSCTSAHQTGNNPIKYRKTDGE